MIRNIWAVGRNYAAHAKEMGQVEPLSNPMIFLKAGSTAIYEPTELCLPTWAEEIHYETEMAVKLDEKLEARAVAVALDLTERSVQSQAKIKGHPWTLAKSFTGACPMGSMRPIENLNELSELTLELKINGEVRQRGVTSDMIFTVSKLITYIRAHFPVCPGDVILTGTPEGVGPLKSGDQIEASLGSFSHMKCVVR